MTLGSLMFVAAVKGSVLILAAWLVMRTFSRMSAALRHLIWASTLGALVLMPVLVRVVPSLRSRFVPAIPVVTSIQTRDVARAAGARDPMPATAAEQPPARVDRGAQSSPLPVARVGALRSIDLEHWFPIAWGVIAAALLLRVAFGRLRLAMLARDASVVDDGEWLLLVQRLAHRLGIARPVTLLRSDRSCVPMTWGLVYPTLLLPRDADGWTAERRTLVLLHELAHVNRLDAFTQFIAQIATAVFWFNPLAWVAARAMRVERELACDDCVIASGVRPSDYAQDLLQIARAFSASSGRAAAALAMARRGDLEDRLLAILDPAADRSAVSGTRLAAASLAILGVAIPLAALSPAPLEAAEHALPPAAVTASRAEPVARAVVRSTIVVASRPTTSTTAPTQAKFTASVPATPDRETLLSVAQAAAKLTSSYDKAELLVPIAKFYRADDELATAYVTAAASIASDYDCSRALNAFLAGNSPLSDKVVELAMTAAVTRMTSDYEKGNVIKGALGDRRVLGPDARRAVIAAISTIHASYDRRMAIHSFVTDRQFNEQDAIALIDATTKISGSYDRAEALVDISAHHALEDAGVRQAYMRAAETISAPSDYRRAIAALVKR
jgi:beta-lactamase regulating signal transducer with metallopeptidase domain